MSKTTLSSLSVLPHPRRFLAPWTAGILVCLILAPAIDAWAKRPKVSEEPPEPPKPPTAELWAQYLATEDDDERRELVRELWYSRHDEGTHAIADAGYAAVSEQAEADYMELWISTAGLWSFESSHWFFAEVMTARLGRPVKAGVAAGDDRAWELLSRVMAQAARQVEADGGDPTNAVERFVSFGLMIPRDVMGAVGALNVRGVDTSGLLAEIVAPYTGKVQLSEADAAAIAPLVDWLRTVDLDSLSKERPKTRPRSVVGLYIMLAHLAPVEIQDLLAEFSIAQIVALLQGSDDAYDDIELILDLVRRGNDTEPIAEAVPEPSIRFIETLGDMLLERSAFEDDPEAAGQLEEIDTGLQALTKRLRAVPETPAP